MTRTELLHNIETMANMEQGSLSEEAVLDDLPEWDSLAVLGVISLFDKNFGLVFKPALIQRCRTIGEVVDLVGERLIQ